MATTTASRAKSANESKNAAANAASVATSKSATASRIIVAGIPKPSEKPQSQTSATTVQASAPAAQPRELTAEEKAAQLQKEIEERTKALKAALTDLEHKKVLNDHRTRFLQTLDHLTAAEEQLNSADDFDGNEPCKISFQGKPDGYRWENIFSIGNADLQREFITFIRAKIRAKVDEIEAELIK